MAKVVGKYKADVQELSIDCKGLNFLTLFGNHVNGGYVAFPAYGVSAELAPNDIHYNKDNIYEALKNSNDSWLPKSDAALEEIALELSEVISPLMNIQ